MRFSSIAKTAGAVLLALVLGACGRNKGPSMPVIGDAYVGPATLKIRTDLPLQSATVATVKHGDRVEILQKRRRFYRVRTAGGAEGWTDERQLMNAADMAGLQEFAVRAAKMPAQGEGLSYSGDLNVHTQPSRLSPSFILIKEKERVDVLAHMTFPRVEVQRAPLLPPPVKKAKAPKKPPKEPKYPPPPLPKPPAPPSDWLELSKTPPDPEAEPEEAPETKPTPTDNWTLVRVKNGQSGWVLTRRLQMAIPDEVAQYAEGRRIVSYFPLAMTQDGDQKKATWLWTTSGSSPQPYDFDSFRVFVWSLKRHRYETAYIERNVRGYSPVLLKDVDLSSGATAGKYPGFSICVEKDDGKRYRREYALLGNVVRFAGDHACEAQEPLVLAGAGSVPVPVANHQGNTSKPSETQPQKSSGFTEKVKQRLQAIKKGLFGG